LSGMRGIWTGQGTTWGPRLAAETEGRIDIPHVSDFDAGELVLDSADGMPTSQLLTLTRTVLRLSRAEGRFGSVTNIDNSDIYLASGARLSLPGVRSLTDRGHGMTWQVDETDTLLDASAIREVVLNPDSVFRINASSRG